MKDMKTITDETTIGEIVRALPASARAFEKLGIDYCCGGKKSLADACRSKKLDATTVIAMLSILDAEPETPRENTDAMTLAELCDHIQQAHHDYLREELPRLDFMTRKVAAVHGEHEPRLLKLREVFETFNAEMTSHTKEEDELIFPAIRRIDAPKENGAARGEDIGAWLKKLEREHDEAGGALAQFETLTDHYTPPERACNTFRALYDALARLERDMHQHVHKENNVLFPKAIAAAG